ncbi:Fur family transcriptional regulator [Owenweeksia hongkongensis]|uniref:Fur family transcriptional regulator n=1 Tax=Owenweeksia hongkongensis TaxID=253245 RepID=UPI003A8E1701
MNAEALLKSHGLRKTAGRLAVLALFSKQGKALSHSELQDGVTENVDRVTLYRILESFEQKGILHKVPDDQVSVKYALCDHDHEVGEAHSDNHAHFKCRVCGDTICLDDSEIPAIQVPTGYAVEGSLLLISGLCAKCA